MRKLLLLLVSAACYGQNYMTVTAAKIQDASGALLPSGRICFQGVSFDTLNPIPYRAGGGGPIHSLPVCVSVSNGVMPNTSIANSSLTSPARVPYAITVTDNTSGNVILQAGPTQISCSTTPLMAGPCSGTPGSSTWNFDMYDSPGTLSIQTSGITATKTIGSCTLTITNGLITSISGC